MCEQVVQISGGNKWKYFFRQAFVSSGLWTGFFLIGLVTGAPTVLIPQLRKEANSTDAVTQEQASWLPVIHVNAALIWDMILPIISAYFGRRFCFVIVAISSLTGFIIFYCSYEIKQIMISSVMMSLLHSSCFNISITIITEYASPEWRGLFLTLKSASFFWGVLVANTIGTFFHWKNIPLLGIFGAVYIILIIYLWPESPYWLAYKGRFEQCESSHRWLKGNFENAENESNKLIAISQNGKVKDSLKIQVQNTIKSVFTVKFCKPVVLALLLLILYVFSGKLVIAVYAIEILYKITENKSTSYIGMLILDGVTVFSMYVGCGIAKVCRRRPMLLICTSLSVLSLYLLSLILFLSKLTIVSQNNYVSLSLLVVYSVAVGCGPMILTTSMAAELIPLELKSIALTISLMLTKIIFSILVKLSPYMFICFDAAGTFLFFAVTTTVLLILVYYYVPETKDKTIYEIIASIEGVKPPEVRIELLTFIEHQVKSVTESSVETETYAK